MKLLLGKGYLFLFLIFSPQYAVFLEGIEYTILNDRKGKPRYKLNTKSWRSSMLLTKKIDRYKHNIVGVNLFSLQLECFSYGDRYLIWDDVVTKLCAIVSLGSFECLDHNSEGYLKVLFGLLMIIQ